MTFLDQNKISEGYKRKDYLWGIKPNRFVIKVPELIRGGSVLDIGVGEGRNAFFLAEKGFEVTGIDISKEAIVKFLDLAQKKKHKGKRFSRRYYEFLI